VIANCPSCGTHYKHEPPKERVRARCGRCDAELDLARMSPYRIVSRLADSAVAVSGGSSKRGSSSSGAPTQNPWNDEDPLPQIPEMGHGGPFDSSLAYANDGVMLRGDADASPRTTASIGGHSATFALWVAAGAIAGTAASWTMGGATLAGLATGAILGAIAGWGWLRWTSPK
jgi:hypothetical protein